MLGGEDKAATILLPPSISGDVNQAGGWVRRTTSRWVCQQAPSSVSLHRRVYMQEEGWVSLSRSATDVVSQSAENQISESHPSLLQAWHLWVMVIRFWTSVWLEFHTSFTPHTCLWFTSHKVVNLNMGLSHTKVYITSGHYAHQYFIAHLWNLTDSHLLPSSTVPPDRIPSNSVTRWSSGNQGHAHLVDWHKLLFCTFCVIC